jgi:hypothetical protein
VRPPSIPKSVQSLQRKDFRFGLLRIADDQASRLRRFVRGVSSFCRSISPGHDLSVDELARVLAGEVLPGPLDDGFEFCAYDRQEGQVDAQPGSEGYGPYEFMVLLAEFGDGGVAPIMARMPRSE